MRRSREIIAIVVLASALAADGTLIAAPTPQAPAVTGTFAGRLVQRISVGLHRSITTPYLYAARRSQLSNANEAIVRVEPVDAMIRPRMVTPFQFRLPPPLV